VRPDTAAIETDSVVIDDFKFEVVFFESILRRNPKDSGVIEILGGLYTKQGRVNDGLRMDRRLVRLQPENPTAHYNLACSLALKNRNPDAIRTLEKSVKLGYSDYEWIQQDPDLEGLRKHPGYKKLLGSLRKKA
jgi:tetratricopeptide (TPR) repeat protein